MKDFYNKKHIKEAERADRPAQLWADQQLMYQNQRKEIQREQGYRDMFKKLDAAEQARVGLYKQIVVPQQQAQAHKEHNRQQHLEQSYYLDQIKDEDRR